MSRFLAFTVGLIAGAFIAQTYKIPDVSDMAKIAIEKTSEYEKKSRELSNKDKKEEKK